MTSSLDARSNLERSWLKSCQMLRKCCQNCWPRVPLGTHWRSEGLARDALGTVCTSLWRLRVVLLTICEEKGDFEILMPFSSRIATFARLATKLELLGHKSHARAAQRVLGQASQRGQDGQVRPVFVGVMETVRKPSGNRRKPAQT